jgi:RsiW-degrading membrane proteinase PrsW (M82 family)
VKIKEQWPIIVGLHRQQPLISLLVWAYALIISSVFLLVFFLPHSGWSSQMTWILVYTFFIGGFSFVLLASTLQALITRVRAGDGGLEWDVMINGVTSGQISDAAYASIRRDVLLDYRIYLA